MALEDASTTKKGVVQLSSANNSTSESLAAT
ncbi:tail fiber protein, partial [Escherichia coli]